MRSSGPRRGSPGLRLFCAILACYWTLGGVYGSVFTFANYSDTYNPREDSGYFPSLPFLVAALVWISAPVLLVIFGLIHLGVDARAGWRWLVAWIGAMAASVGLVLLLWSFWPLSRPALLVVSGGFFLVGMVMVATLIGATRAEREPAEDAQ
jgi:hypothetical protein